MKEHYHNSKQQSKQGVKFERDTCQLVALDTNVFIDMSHGANQKRPSSGSIFYSKIMEIKDKAEKGLVKFVITPSVFGELSVHGLSQVEKDFINKYCYILKPKNPEEFARKVVELSNEYIRSGKMAGTSKPFGDAKIMAECAVAGLNVLTNNYRDFIIYYEDKDRYKHDGYGDIIPRANYNERNNPTDVTHFNKNELVRFLRYKKRLRALDIGSINNALGYSYRNRNGYDVCPMPFTTMDYMGKMSEKQGLFRTNQFVTNFNSKECDLEQMAME